MNLQLPILSILSLSHPRALKKSVLMGDLRMEVQDPPSWDSLNRALSQLEAKGQVRIDQGEDVDRISITSSGRSRVAEAN